MKTGVRGGVPGGHETPEKQNISVEKTFGTASYFILLNINYATASVEQ